MISVILYGRNDSHGYNLPKRAAISINCIAEMLSEAGDEILFVDYNTPNDLPTFVEAIYDTLTTKARSRLRLLRVRPAVHVRIAPRTHLAALEPHSRNIGIRRSNPRNRWVLFTNTDMVFVPRKEIFSLSAAVQDLSEGLYILPRFELPEPLWESFPRSDPVAIMRKCEELGPRLHLDEVAVSHPYMRFDSPGDFQLVPRKALFDIHGFDERMIHGWHADSNICKRFFLFYGRHTESLADRLKGYHCDHTRVATLAHRLDIKLENDLQEFVYGVEEPVAHHQAGTWGLPNEPVEELDLTNGPQARFVSALERVLAVPQRADYTSDANDLRNFVFYHPEHALPHLAGNLTVYPPNSRLVYAGNNPRMLELTARCVREMGFTHPLYYDERLLSAGRGPDCASPDPADLSAANYDLIIFDFGLDPSGLSLGKIARVTDWPRELRYSLGAVARTLEGCAELCGGLKRSNRPMPDFLVLNANHHIFRDFVGQFVIATETPYNTHVRKGRPRIGHERLYRSHAWKYTEDAMRSLFGYDSEGPSLPAVTAGHSIDFTSSGRSGLHKDGHWGAMDLTGTWTDGRVASVLFGAPVPPAADLLAFVRVTEALLGLAGEPIQVQVLFEGELLARWIVRSRFAVVNYKLLLPGHLLAGREVCRLTFQIENPQSTHLHAVHRGEQTIGEDPRELGIKVSRIAFAGTDCIKYRLAKTVDFTQKGEGMFHVNESWSQPDDLGTWTMGEDANLVLYLSEPVETPVISTFYLTDVAVSEAYPHLNISVDFNGLNVADWILGPSRMPEERKVLVPADILRRQNPLNISFHIDSPRTLQELKWSDVDTRRLGFRLTSLRMDPVDIQRYKFGEIIDFTAAGNGRRFLGSHWTLPDRYGSWTVGESARMTMRFEEKPVEPVALSFVVSDCMVSLGSPELPVRVSANGHLIGEWILGPDRVPQVRSVELPAGVMTENAELDLAFEIPTPRTPASLGWSSDSRPLGLRLTRAAFGGGKLTIPSFQEEKQVPPSFRRRLLDLSASIIRGLRLSTKRALF
jgi:hypothetical protein